MRCRLLSVSRSGFYVWVKWQEGQYQQGRRRVGTVGEAEFLGVKKRYSTARIMLELNAQGIQCCVIGWV